MGKNKLLGLLISRALHRPYSSSSLPQNPTSDPARFVRPVLPSNGVLSRRPRFFTTIAQNLSITDNCVRRLQDIIKEDGSSANEKMLRVSVEGGGCSGFQYVFTLEDNLSNTDRVFEKDGVKVIVDEISMDFLKGSTIDYAEELIRSSFMVTQNPNASGSCGCGSSFNAK
eukprot:c2106_g1_i1 orf=333-842(-)